LKKGEKNSTSFAIEEKKTTNNPARNGAVHKRRGSPVA
jgi:hypothetical protein